MSEKVTVASESLNSCAGCEIAVIDLGTRLLDVLGLIEFLHIPVLMDHKYYGQTGDKLKMSIPEAAVGLISGGIRNQEHLEVAKEMRKKCKTIIALGTCATHGGIPALINEFTNDDLMKRYYSTESTDQPNEWPNEGVPPLLDRCYAVDEKIKVDVYLPGCPPHPDNIINALTALIKGNAPDLPMKSVCDTCPAIRHGKGQVKKLQRFFNAPEYKISDELIKSHEADKNSVSDLSHADHGKFDINNMRCLLEQGILCMGPVTRAGCGGDNVIPRCISAGVPCRGCYGPVKQDGNQMLDMLNALASNGIDIKSLPEYASMLRFSGAHNLLKPKFIEKEE